MKRAIKQTPQLPLALEVAAPERPRFSERTVFHIGVSGGKDSGAALLWMLHESGIDWSQINVTFCDTGNEHQWTYAHVQFLSENVFPIETLYPEHQFFELALKKRRFPSTKARFCTEFLKIAPSRAHIEKLIYAGKNPIAVSGVRADESEDRAQLLEWGFSATMGCIQWRPLIRWTIDDVIAIHRRYNVPLNPLCEAGAMRVGCWPCIMSRKSEIRVIATRFPERIEEIRKAEQEFEKRYGRYSSFFPATTVPERFRTKPYQLPSGEWINVATIDDVVRWSLTGKGAKGHYTENQEKEPVTCTSGYCE